MQFTKPGPIDSLKGAQAGANISKKEEKLIKALLDMFNFYNYSYDRVHTNFTVKDRKIVSLLSFGIDRIKYLQKLAGSMKEDCCDTEAEKVYVFNQFPFAFPFDSNYRKDEGGMTDITYDISGAAFNLKIYFIQRLKKDVEEEVIEELVRKEEITDEEACEYEGSVHLEKTNDPNSYLCNISFSDEHFQGQPKLFEKFKGIYVEKFKSWLEECNLDDRSVDCNIVHIKDAIDINAVKNIEKRMHSKANVRCFTRAEAETIIDTHIALDEKNKYYLDLTLTSYEKRRMSKKQQPTKKGTSKSWKGANERRTIDKPLTEEEKELFKALLYAFNYSNKDFECPGTNFIVKNGKIVSLINDDVDVKEYLKEVRGETIKKYCVNEKEAYDLNEFPFKFLSNCEKNQKMTVVADISHGALFNLKKLFIYGYKKKVKIGDTDIKIGDINTKIVEEAVKSKKRGLVKFKLKGGERKAGYYQRIPYEGAVTGSYPDEKALEYISIRKHETGYHLNRTCEDWETESFAKQYCAEGTSVAGKVKPEDNKDSGISSGEATDAENVSSKAEATTSGYESMDCENTRGGSLKRNSPSPEDGGSSKKSRSESGNSSSEEEPRSNLSDSDSEGLCTRVRRVVVQK